jgi:cysteinyl-tRNA synthetase
MALKYLGERIDISAGGVDLIFPHHENTMALSEGYTHGECASFWLHSAHLTVEGGKMSKSLRNYYTLRDILKKGYEPRGIRLFLLSTHYRKEADLTFKKLDRAQKKARTLVGFYNELGETGARRGKDKRAFEAFKKMRMDFERAMDDDLNMEEALNKLFEFIKVCDPKKVDRSSAGKMKRGLLELDRVLGLIEGF